MVKFFMAVVLLSVFGTTFSEASKAEPLDTSFVKAYKFHSDAWIAVSLHIEQGLSNEDADTLVRDYFAHFLPKLYRDNLMTVVETLKSDYARQLSIQEFIRVSRDPLSPADLTRLLGRMESVQRRAEVILTYLAEAPHVVHLTTILEMTASLTDFKMKTAVFDKWITVTHSRYLRKVYESDLTHLNRELGTETFSINSLGPAFNPSQRSGTYQLTDNAWIAVRSCDEILRIASASARL